MTNQLTDSTPRPWKVSDNASRHGVPILAGRGFGHVVAYISGPYNSETKDRNNAELIVTAVNSYSVHLEEIKQLRAQLQQVTEERDKARDAILTCPACQDMKEGEA